MGEADTSTTAKQLTPPKMSEAFMESADVLLVGDDDVAVPCHSHILSMHSAALCNALKHSPRQQDGKVRLSLADFTEAQCSALQHYLCSTSVSCKGVAFEEHNATAFDAAAAVARFARTYDMPHVLRHVEAYTAAFLDSHYKTKGPVVTAGSGSSLPFSLCKNSGLGSHGREI